MSACFVPGCRGEVVVAGLCTRHEAELVDRTRWSAPEHLERRAELARVNPDATTDEVRQQVEHELGELEQQRRAQEARERLATLADHGDRLERYSAAAIRGVVERFLEDVAKGEGRNVALTGAAYAIGRITGGTGHDGAPELREAALATGLPEREADDVIRRQTRKGQANPCTVPDLTDPPRPTRRQRAAAAGTTTGTTGNRPTTNGGTTGNHPPNQRRRRRQFAAGRRRYRRA